MIVIDSSVWIDDIRKSPTPQVTLLRRINTGQVIVGDLVVLEVLRGLRSDSEAEVHERRFRAFGITTLSSSEIAVDAARNYRKLRSLGITIRSTIDMVIATFCLAHGHQLLHDDRDFDHFERYLGLRVLR